MSAGRRLLVAFALAVAGAAALSAASPGRSSLALPGRVVAAAALPGGGAALATLDEGGVLALWRLDVAGGAPRLQPFPLPVPGGLSPLPAEERESPSVTLLALRDGGVVLSRPGAVWLLAEGGASRLLAEPGFALAAAADAGVAALSPPVAWPVVVARAGELRLLDPRSPASAVRTSLPVAAQPRSWGLELSSPPVHQPPAAASGVAATVGPTKVGERRLRTLLVDGAGAVSEVWSLLPAGERLLAGRVLTFDGEPVLAITAAPAGMLAVQRLHIFPLAGDRSKRGSTPVFSAQLQVRHWLAPELVTGDRDGDGRSDLLVIEPRGLGGGELTVSIYRGLGKGRLAPAGRHVRWDDAHGSWSYGADLTGDGRADFVRLSRGKVTLHPGVAGERAVRGAPVWTVEVGGGMHQRSVSVGVGVGAGAESGASVESTDGAEEARRGRDSRGREKSRQEPDDEDGDDDESDGLGASTLAVQDLDGDGTGEVLVWRRLDAGGSELLVLSPR